MRFQTIILQTLFITAFFLTGCRDNVWNTGGSADDSLTIKIQRYDRLQSRYLTTGDFSALQQMNTTYPIETRTLIENVLQLGTVDQQDINERFLKFYQDTVLQAIITEAEAQYANIDDLNRDLTLAFKSLKKEIPSIPVPTFYTQIGALDQSVIVGDGVVGISLDKYLGKDYKLYRRYYPDSQLQTMTRDDIVPDCLTFYILSLYPLKNFENRPQAERDAHIGKVMWLVNNITQRDYYTMDYVKATERYMKQNPKAKIANLLVE